MAVGIETIETISIHLVVNSLHPILLSKAFHDRLARQLAYIANERVTSGM